MNNGKVRIYELSKELNLENKDLLDICGQLNIAVKSHSSTITESQAERIRSAAQRYAPNASGKNGGVVTDRDNGALDSRDGRKGKRKQQILAIHKHNRPRSAPGEGPQATASPVLSPPPRPPVKPQPPTLETDDRLEASPPELIPFPEVPELEDPSPTQPDDPTATVAQAPQLLRPPARQEEKPAPARPEIEKPVPVLPRPEVKAPEVKAPGGPSRPMPLPAPRSAQAAPSAPERREKKQEELKSPPRLQKPQPPRLTVETKSEPEPAAPSEPEVVEEIVEEDLLADSKRPKAKLKRPTPPRPAKAGAWEEEEEETQEADKAGKVGKAGKNKRRQLIDDDEEELVTMLETGTSSSLFSLSTARPPKPQSNLGTAAVPPSVKKPKKPAAKAESTPRAKSERREVKEERPEKVVLSESLTLRELADLIKVSETEIITKLFLKGVAVNITQTLDMDTARLVAEEFGIQVETAARTDSAAKGTEMLDEADLENLQLRPPVVTIMGHVDHGKTTLLDSIRKTKVAQGEAGGITQHIGAYHVDIDREDQTEQIVFLDTPGHEAFTAMRARGARVTDIAVLVVAADDGVRPQTREAISHARAAQVPIVVAINKIDKPGAEPDRVKQELTELSLVPEEWGGDTIMVPVSALKGENLDTLLEMLLLVAEIEELSANPHRPAKGTVIEANLDRTKGPVATLLVQNGTLRVGDTIVAGAVLGKIRAMIDDRGNRVEAATPSFAVEVLGLSDVPAAGDEFEVFESEKEARAVADRRVETQRQSRLQQAMSSRRVTLSSLSAQAQEGELKELNLILKADVQGSVEAILGSLKQLPQNEVQLRVLLAAPGEVTETDVDLAAASGAVILGFNTTLASGARATADQEGVDIREYDVIYKLLDDVQGAMEGLLDPEELEEALGVAEVRAVFPVGRGTVAGCYVQSGKVVRNRPIRVRRGNEVVYQGALDSLKRMKEDAREVNAGYECGIGSAKFNEWQEGDRIEAYEMVFKRRTLSS